MATHPRTTIGPNASDGSVVSHQEIADLLGISAQAVQATEQRALRKMRDVIHRLAKIDGVSPERWMFE